MNHEFKYHTDKKVKTLIKSYRKQGIPETDKKFQLLMEEEKRREGNLPKNKPYMKWVLVGVGLGLIVLIAFAPDVLLALGYISIFCAVYLGGALLLRGKQEVFKERQFIIKALGPVSK